MESSFSNWGRQFFELPYHKSTSLWGQFQLIRFSEAPLKKNISLLQKTASVMQYGMVNITLQPIL
jgi:hypothetical protein